MGRLRFVPVAFAQSRRGLWADHAATRRKGRVFESRKLVIAAHRTSNQANGPERAFWEPASARLGRHTEAIRFDPLFAVSEIRASRRTQQIRVGVPRNFNLRRRKMPTGEEGGAIIFYMIVPVKVEPTPRSVSLRQQGVDMGWDR